ncbi:MAG TPA: CaiB/BaiF CoA-transferase family protein [Amaricoccus sp.]|uniref:CaiB/BaiF CoA transferase family protein n=1 Tax=Amaricoccus sp. TaxID=1872485 RepID=UPI002BB7133C|nr:CaiB/BaiF CoA-transferase family protein [Amaricoccus sp.]HRO10866.1 CaiB/BaiF CoA-transferase family protein [Amaricoccus sp.]
MSPGTRPGGPLAGLKVVEMAGIGPAPMCGMLLADLGAEIVRIDRPGESDVGIKRPPETNFLLRGRPTIRLDLKDPAGRDRALALAAAADCLIEGFRPGVMERLGLGPGPCLERNPRLVYGRVTGWGQTGPMAPWAGHDLNYIGLTGALEALGRADSPPPAPLNLIGDFGGGALFLALGLLAGVVEAARSGRGQVVDAAIVDGVAAMMTSLNGLRAGGVFPRARQASLLDSGAFFYDVYACADGRHLAVGAIEPRFFATFLARLGLGPDDLPPQADASRWPEGRARLRALFATRPRDHWVALFAGSDACVTPVLSLEESFADPHLRARGTYAEAGGFPQAAPAPRFSRTPPPPPGPPDAPLPLPPWAAALG